MKEIGTPKKCRSSEDELSVNKNKMSVYFSFFGAGNEKPKKTTIQIKLT